MGEGNVTTGGASPPPGRKWRITPSGYPARWTWKRHLLVQLSERLIDGHVLAACDSTLWIRGTISIALLLRLTILVSVSAASDSTWFTRSNYSSTRLGQSLHQSACVLLRAS